jgi:hypothetical protein
MLTVLSTLEKLGKDHYGKSAQDLETFYIHTAFSSEASLLRVKALSAIDSFPDEIKDEFPAIGKRIANGKYNLEQAFFKMQPTYQTNMRKLADLRKPVPEHANVYVSEVERKFHEMIDETKKKVTSLLTVKHYAPSCFIFVKIYFWISFMQAFPHLLLCLTVFFCLSCLIFMTHRQLAGWNFMRV